MRLIRTTKPRVVARMITLLHGLDDEQCNMALWYQTHKTKFPPQETRGAPGCGLTACLAAWAAIKFAPTVIGRMRSGEWANAEAILFVPEKWAKRHKIPTYDEKSDFAPARPVRQGVRYVAAEVAAIGAAALGLYPASEVYHLFTWAYSPSRTEKTDRTWMIEQLTAIRERSV